MFKHLKLAVLVTGLLAGSALLKEPPPAREITVEPPSTKRFRPLLVVIAVVAAIGVAGVPPIFFVGALDWDATKAATVSGALAVVFATGLQAISESENKGRPIPFADPIKLIAIAISWAAALSALGTAVLLDDATVTCLVPGDPDASCDVGIRVVDEEQTTYCRVPGKPEASCEVVIDG